MPGTTTRKSLRFPLATEWADEVYYDTQQLAEDINGAFVGQDARLSGLDTKTNATNQSLNTLGLIAARYGNCAGVYTHSPNDGAVRTISQHTDQFYIPSAAKRALVCAMSSANISTANGGTNAMQVWYPIVSFTTGGGNWYGFGEYVSHNNGNHVLDLGFSAVAEFNVEAFRGNYGSVAVQAYNAAGSADWVLNGPMRWSVTLLT